MSKRNLLGALIIMFGLSLEAANAAHCTCWFANRCVGRVDPFGGDLAACGNACRKYKPDLPHVNPYIDGISLQKCKDEGKAEPALGAW